MKTNKLTLHLGKTKVQLIGSNKKVTTDTKIVIEHDGHILEQVYIVKQLGVYVDSNLTWQAHYDFICKKISQKVGVLKRIKSYVSMETLKMIYNAIVLPNMEYACIVWGRCPNIQNNVGRVCKLRKRAARVILNVKISDISSADLFKKIHWMPFSDRITFKRAIMMYKVVNKLAPTYLQHFTPIVHRYNTRNAARGNLHTDRANLKYYTRSFKHEGSRVWNELSDHIRQAETLHQFKSRYLAQHFNN